MKMSRNALFLRVKESEKPIHKISAVSLAVLTLKNSDHRECLSQKRLSYSHKVCCHIEQLQTVCMVLKQSYNKHSVRITQELPDIFSQNVACSMIIGRMKEYTAMVVMFLVIVCAG